MRTAVVILNWNTRTYLQAFLPSVVAACRELGEDPATGLPCAEAVVADSGSTDGSDALMAEAFPDVRFLPLGANYGFTGGYNRALAALDGFDCFLLLNSDILVENGFLTPLCDWMQAHPDCGVCGPKLLALEQDGKEWRKTTRFEYAGAAGGLLDRFGYPFCRGRVLSRVEEDRGQYDTPARVLWVSGACMMVRSSLWKDLGGFDDRFFAHMEEIDFCWRAAHAGWKVTVVPQSKVWHLGGGSLPQDSPFKLELNYRNNLLLLENNLAAEACARGCSPKRAQRSARCAIFRRMLLDGCSAVVYLLRGRFSACRAVCSAHRQFRKLRRGVPVPEGPRPAPAEGLFPGIVILQYLKQNENHH
ncbi:MAG: glycosyltransferase family 2 protein [Bacteroidales bacterium]|nr:glycosyltransferase family 2 protein [Bacteroidales bacterium]